MNWEVTGEGVRFQRGQLKKASLRRWHVIKDWKRGSHEEIYNKTVPGRRNGHEENGSVCPDMERYDC